MTGTCDSLTSITAPTIGDYEALLSADNKLTIPEWTTDPANCVVAYSFTASPSTYTAGITFDSDPAIREFTVDFPSQSRYIRTFELTVTGQGLLDSSTSQTAQFDITVVNPCANVS